MNEERINRDCGNESHLFHTEVFLQGRYTHSYRCPDSKQTEAAFQIQTPVPLSKIPGFAVAYCYQDYYFTFQN